VAIQRKFVASTTALGLALTAGVYIWSLSLEPATKPIESDVKVVRGTSLQDTHAVQRADHVPNVPLKGSPRIAGAQTGTPTILDDANLRAALPDPDLEPRALYERLRAEPRDAEWAARSERSIKAAMTPVPYISQDDLRVSCASTLCEIRGSMPEGLTNDNANVGMEALQGEKLHNTLVKAGLQTAMASFGGGNGAQSFTIYATRR
jgi:hypothetical protein